MCQGASDGMKLTLNVLAMLIGFTAAIALFNYLLTQPQQWAGIAQPVTIDMLLGWINAPFAFLMGVPWADCAEVGQAFGKRIVFTDADGVVDGAISAACGWVERQRPPMPRSRSRP